MELWASSIYPRREVTVKWCIRDVGAPQNGDREKLCWSEAVWEFSPAWMGVPMWFCRLLPPLGFLLLTDIALLQLHPSALSCMVSSWVLIDMVSLFCMGLWTQTISISIINKYKRPDTPWSWLENDRGGNFGRSIWKYPEKEKQGQC